MTGSDLWVRLMDEIVRGVHHELNNRVASLSAVEQVVSAGGSMTERLRAALISELERMRSAVVLVGRIPPSDERPLEAMRLMDAVTSAVELIRLRHESRDVRVDFTAGESLLPVRCDPAAVQRSLLVMLAMAARAAGAGQVTVTCSSADARVEVSVGPAPSGGTGDTTKEAERLAIAAWLRPSNGVLESHPHDGAWTISLPALTASPARPG